MGPLLAIYPTCTSQERTKPMLFCHWNLSQHEKSMPPPLNWDGLPIQRNFLKWPPAKWNYVFAYYSESRIDRDNILVSKLMFVLDDEFNDDTEKSIWLLVNSEFKMAVLEINRNDINWPIPVGTRTSLQDVCKCTGSMQMSWRRLDAFFKTKSLSNKIF